LEFFEIRKENENPVWSSVDADDNQTGLWTHSLPLLFPLFVPNASALCSACCHWTTTKPGIWWVTSSGLELEVQDQAE
jgi:hypothetical protein